MDSNKPTTFDKLIDDKGREYYAVDNAELIWTNFAGLENDFNRKGKRNFNWLIPNPEWGQILAERGFNIRHRSVRDGFDGDEFDHLKVDIAYETEKGEPIEDINPEWYPRIYILNDDDEAIPIEKDALAILDGKTILYALFEFRPHDWNVGGKTGTSAKLKRLFIKIRKDPLEGRFKIRDTGAIRPNDYFQIAQEVHRERAARREAEQQVPADPKDLPFEI